MYLLNIYTHKHIHTHTHTQQQTADLSYLLRCTLCWARPLSWRVWGTRGSSSSPGSAGWGRPSDWGRWCAVWVWPPPSPSLNTADTTLQDIIFWFCQKLFNLVWLKLNTSCTCFTLKACQQRKRSRPLTHWEAFNVKHLCRKFWV